MTLLIILLLLLLAGVGVVVYVNREVAKAVAKSDAAAIKTEIDKVL